MLTESQTKAFHDFLIKRSYEWDKQILKDAEFYCDPIRIDVRLLPNNLRLLFSLIHFQGFTFKQCAKRFRISTTTARRRYHKADSLVSKRLQTWLKTLSKYRSHKERDKRLYHWIGYVNTGSFEKVFTVPTPQFTP